jgi:hypothetical protein
MRRSLRERARELSAQLAPIAKSSCQREGYPDHKFEDYGGFGGASVSADLVSVVEGLAQAGTVQSAQWRGVPHSLIVQRRGWDAS